MKNAIIAILLVLVIGMPVGYYIYRHQRTKVVVKAPEKFKFTIGTKTPGAKGYILFAPTTDAEAELMIVDLAGKVIYQKHINSSVFDFRQWRIGNKTYYTYGQDDTTAFHGKGPFLAAGPIVLLDSALNEITRMHLLPYDDVDLKKHNELDPHDLVMLSEDHFYTLVSYEKAVNNIPASLNPLPGKRVNAALIQERIGDKVVWQWDASKFPEFYENSEDAAIFRDSLPADYLHVNTLTLDPNDSNLIVSFRSLHEIIKVDRHTGNILWRLGGKKSDFPLTDEQKFLGQHAVKLIDNGRTLHFIDNGSSKTRPFTRIFEMQLDEKNKKITAFHSYKVPHSFIPSRGNVSKVDDNLLICGGIAKYILLTDPKTDKYLFEMQFNWQCYRAYFVDSLYGLEKNVAAN